MFQNQDVFPTTSYYDKTPTGCSDGLNARQYFAIKTLQGLLSNSEVKNIPKPMLSSLRCSTPMP